MGTTTTYPAQEGERVEQRLPVGEPAPCRPDTRLPRREDSSAPENFRDLRTRRRLA
jgi:hypothetical protein